MGQSPRAPRNGGSPPARGPPQRDWLPRTPLPGSFADALRSSDLYPLRPTTIEILQINVGKRCNQTCRHCHVDAGPDRVEEMPRPVLEACLSFLERARIQIGRASCRERV